MEDAGISLFIADVDGTLLTPAKELTPRALAAVRELKRRGIRFSITSGRPPRGMKMLIEPLELTDPIAAFNGGVFVRPDLSVIEEHVLAQETSREVLRILEHSGVDIWFYRDSDWLIRDPGAPHVEKERHTVRFDPQIVSSFDGHLEDLVKIVGISDDPEKMTKAEEAIRKELGVDVSATRSQAYYLDITHPSANKGTVALRLGEFFKIPCSRIATIGDMPNDVLMFRHSGLSIAMGNARDDVKKSARLTTASNTEEGFADAIERFVLKRSHNERVA